MKKIITTIISILLLTALAKNDTVELDAFLNARSSMNFLKNTKNVVTTLPKGTKGKVEEFVKLPSGNFGLKMTVLDGKHKDKSVWIYYNNKSPMIKLVDEAKTVIDPKVEDDKKREEALRKAREAELLEKKKAIVEPTPVPDQGVKEAIDIISKPRPLDHISPELMGKLADCFVRGSINYSISSIDGKKDYNESMDIPPLKEINETSVEPSRCGNPTNNPWNTCVSSSGKIESFNIINSGGNDIVTAKEYYINRSYEFQFEDQARSDMRLMVVDSPDDRTSHSTYSFLTFAPRLHLPSVKKLDEDKMEVTLPTKEKVIFDSKTKKIIGGVLTEGPMVQDERGRAKPANLKYSGEGVLIRADKSGDFPMGDIERSDGTKAPSISIATISKKGQKDCKVPAKDMWYTNYDKGQNVMIKPELASDEGLDKFIKARCGFSIYN